MAKILLFIDNALLAEFPLDKTTTRIGRRPSNDLHIDNLAVSGEHAVIVKMGNDYYIEDVGSTNGTTVNGDEIQKHLLQHGDTIELGKHQLKFIKEEILNQLGTEPKVEDTGFENTVAIRPAAKKIARNTEQNAAAIAEELPAMASPTGEVSAIPEAAIENKPQPAKIQVLNGASVGHELLLNKAMTTLGKSGVQVAVITKRANGFFVTHVEGAVYPSVNNQTIGAHAHALNHHDVIEIAGIKMEFFDAVN